MAIVLTEIEAVLGDANKQRAVYYRCQDDLGQWHKYGPIVINDPAFDVEAHKAVVAKKLAEQLADREFEQVLE
jgi:hypothetical protein